VVEEGKSLVVNVYYPAVLTRGSLRRTAAREIHTSLGLSAAATNHASGLSGEASGAGGGNSAEFESRVRKVSELLEAISLDLCPRG
jgi:hypothetical protein